MARARMDGVSLAELGLALFFGIAGGIYVGARLALGMAGQFVEESIAAIRSTAFELLANKTLQDLIRASEKIPKLGGEGGIASGIGGFIAKQLGIKLG